MAEFKDVDYRLVDGVRAMASALPLNLPTVFLRMEEVPAEFFPETTSAATEGFRLTRRCYFSTVLGWLRLPSSS
jgi:hypothetical protein